jgi:poly(hydroxyalkanoate) depolymerase family esterase
MVKSFQDWFSALLRDIRARYARWTRPRRGKYVVGRHREPGGVLVLAPLVAPERRYRLYLPRPNGDGKPLPMLVMLHGCRQDAEALAAGARMNRLADRHQFMVLYPEQSRYANPQRCWNWFDPSGLDGHGEAAIVAGMVREVATLHRVDPKRIYVAGMSAGGAIAGILASCYAELFAGCAIHSGLMFQAAASPHAATEAMKNGSRTNPEEAGERAWALSGHKVDAMPVMVIHGDRDEQVARINADQIMTDFARMNRLPYPADESLPSDERVDTRYGAEPRGYRWKRIDYLRDGKTLLRQLIVEGMGHAWSGGNPNYPFNDPHGPDASELIWEFLRTHQRVEQVPQPVLVTNEQGAYGA